MSELPREFASGETVKNGWLLEKIFTKDEKTFGFSPTKLVRSEITSIDIVKIPDIESTNYFVVLNDKDGEYNYGLFEKDSKLVGDEGDEIKLSADEIERIKSLAEEKSQ